MNDTLTRFQVYLDSQDVVAITNIAKDAGVSRSQIIRDATKAVALRYIELGALKTYRAQGRNPLLDLIGVEKSSTGRVGLDVDKIYSKLLAK